MKTTDRYAELDQALCERIGEDEVSFLKLLTCVGEQAKKLCVRPATEPFRLVDRRLQALKKKGLIKFTRSKGSGGWVKVQKVQAL